MSAQRGRLQAVIDAIARGVDINATSHEGDTALMRAAQAGHAPVVDWLIAAGASLNVRNAAGESALTLATRAGQVDVTRRLRMAGAVIPIMKFDQGLRALRNAVVTNAHAEAIAWMIAGLTPGEMYPCLVQELQPSFNGAGDESRSDAAARRALLVARTQNANALPMALRIQLSLDTHIVTAAADERLGLVQALRSEGANLPERCVGVARDALMEDAHVGRTAGVQAWLAAGVSVNAVDGEQRTALMHASMPGNTGLLNMLINEGARLDLQDQHGNTALIYAAKAGKNSAIELLLKKGASMGLADNQGLSPIDWAAKGFHLKVLNTLVRNGARFTVEHMRHVILGLARRRPVRTP
ncbi:ankyrin repeat domain-containing protein [Ottowia thiooxydans]